MTTVETTIVRAAHDRAMAAAQQAAKAFSDKHFGAETGVPVALLG